MLPQAGKTETVWKYKGLSFCEVHEHLWTKIIISHLAYHSFPPISYFLVVLEKEMATHSSVPAWRIPRTGEPGGLPSMGSHRVGHDWSDLAAATIPKTKCIFFWETAEWSNSQNNNGGCWSFQLKLYKKMPRERDFLGGPVVKTLHSQCRGHGFDPWWGN